MIVHFDYPPCTCCHGNGIDWHECLMMPGLESLISGIANDVASVNPGGRLLYSCNRGIYTHSSQDKKPAVNNSPTFQSM